MVETVAGGDKNKILEIIGRYHQRHPQPRIFSEGTLDNMAFEDSQDKNY